MAALSAACVRRKGCGELVSVKYTLSLKIDRGTISPRELLECANVHRERRRRRTFSLRSMCVCVCPLKWVGVFPFEFARRWGARDFLISFVEHNAEQQHRRDAHVTQHIRRAYAPNIRSNCTESHRIVSVRRLRGNFYHPSHAAK